MLRSVIDMSNQDEKSPSGEFTFTPEEEAFAEDEAMAFVYGMAGAGMGAMIDDPLLSAEGMAIFLAKKEEILYAIRAARLKMR